MLIQHPTKLAKLQAELDEAFPSPLPNYFVAEWADCKDLSYVNGVIYETLRLKTVVSVGLPRVVSKGGMKVCGEFFEKGTVLSTPTYTTHRDPRVWGSDALEFLPERWEGEKKVELEKAFLGFSYGPRACIGRNVGLFPKCLSSTNERNAGRIYGVEENSRDVIQEIRISSGIPR